LTAQTLAPPEQIVQLSGISWQTYETLLAEIGDRQFRLTYNRGNLEIRPLAKFILIKFCNRQDACSTRKNVFCGTGILPVLVIFAILSIMIPSPEHEVYKKVMDRFVETLVGCAMRTGSSCNVRNMHRKSQSQPVHSTLQITKFQAFSALRTKLSKHLDRVGCLGCTLQIKFALKFC